MMDTYFNLTGNHCHPIPSPGNIINVPASRFLRPYQPKFKLLDGLKLRRIKKALAYAAEKNLIYHLWWHPHNFGKYMDENFSFLESILKYYHQLNKAGKMDSQNLIEIYYQTMHREAN